MVFLPSSGGSEIQNDLYGKTLHAAYKQYRQIEVGTGFTKIKFHLKFIGNAQPKWIAMKTSVAMLFLCRTIKRLCNLHKQSLRKAEQSPV